ncbi:MAG: hypothetical protein PHE21_03575, partial [Candidatus Dojkabacteria bacterium]|nr:hypothetical protein [Candidatus Dojkabacteria bacterium]
VFLGNVKESEIEQEVDKALSFDDLFIDKLTLMNCILNLKTDNTSWNASRGEGEDKYERKEVQEICTLAYRFYEDRVGSGWEKIVTRRDGKWRSRGDIRDECISFISQRMHINKGEKGSLNFVDLNSIISTIYPNVKIASDIYKLWSNSARVNDKKGIYESSVKIGGYISNNLVRIDMSNDVKGKFKEILSDYPEIYSLLDEFAGKRYSNILVKTLNG